MTEAEPLTFLIQDVARLIRQRFEVELGHAGLGITAGEARILLWAGRMPGLRQTALAERLGVEPMTLVGFLDRLEAAGLARRAPDPADRRAKLVHPTNAALPMIEKIEAIALAVRRVVTGDLGERQSDAVRNALIRMRSALSGEDEAKVA